MHQYKITSALCVKYKQETEYDHKTMKYMKANEDKNVNMVNVRCFFVSSGL